jgi:hypothetical protein
VFAEINGKVLGHKAGLNEASKKVFGYLSKPALRGNNV